MGFKLGFQEYWDIVEENVIEVVKKFLNQTLTIALINQTFIVLILKLKVSKSSFDFRPIGLCNDFYKIISKIMANRMKGVFPKIIPPHQSVFVKGRHIYDNPHCLQDAPIYDT